MTIADGRPEEYAATWAQTWHNVVRPFLPTNILVFLVCWVLGYAFGGPVLSVVLPVVVSGGTLLLQRVVSRRSTVRVSGYGIEVCRRSGEVTGMRWVDVQQVAVLHKKRTGVVAPYGMPRAAGQASAVRYASANSGPGLVGQGSRRGPAATGSGAAGPEWLERQDTTVPVQLFLVVVDRDWPSGRIGDWLRAYRPDLVSPAPTGAP